ncbi:MAG: hypothetical protein CMF76_09320 [Maricaulis sp.]|nr:hypothetical protein [Oceanicaulis sp.]MAZ92147.1 hypothetical protein [Maricaulis sp.]
MNYGKENWHIAEIDGLQVRTDPGYEGMLEVRVMRPEGPASLTISAATLQALADLATRAGVYPPRHAGNPRA